MASIVNEVNMVLRCWRLFCIWFRMLEAVILVRRAQTIHAIVWALYIVAAVAANGIDVCSIRFYLFDSVRMRVCVCVLRFDIRSSTHNTQNTSLHSSICVPSPSTYNLNTVFGIESIWLFIISVCDAISQMYSEFNSRQYYGFSIVNCSVFIYLHNEKPNVVVSSICQGEICDFKLCSHVVFGRLRWK